ncbi:DUF3573 domain-containing protein [Francisella adeliensis]|uniref:DUF3573 domain-containing protein n=1 Tax=Francisella adeliensis TaxID=2007306 RepID=A0A2Z4Y0R2_9GAMM|nr:DUF3573 domain-containing protein [Francisella adeliensis]AXA34468.1 hypothetical protein CDH04_08700 [Francisella adeliensis]MBK2086187.1 DUF3573 domain-containing protein [Francisella adeliensis]MBK2096404.1 DUF3573 domain-containing protein [Francisella adeliensis]QIW12715.1 DUF3573 domain-containing protein [Francisella adeliensis]QIW14591.1 DUF3573 domain-containing protein [Francisella adeliensis]
MIKRFKKTCLVMGGAVIFTGSAYAEDSPKVVSQGGPFGATSIGDQNLSSSQANTSKASAATATNTPAKPTAQMNEKELLMQLQKQVQELQGQLKQIKTEKAQNGENGGGGSSAFTTYSSRVGDDTKGGPASRATSGTDLSQMMVTGESTDDIMSNIGQDGSIVNLDQKSLGGIFNQKGGIDVGGAPAITSQGETTFLGSYSGNNSIPIGMISSSLFASTLLGQREKFDDYSVFFGGLINADAQAWFGSGVSRSEVGPDGKSVAAGAFNGTGQNVYLTGANLYFLSNLGHYVTAQFDFDTDESGSFGLGNAFVMFGNLDTSPFFVTAGRNKLSVGVFGGGGPYTGGINGFLAPGKTSNVSINYKNDTINTNITVFGSDDKRANFSTGLFYVDSWTENVAVGGNVGYVFNMAGAGNSSLNQALINTDSANDNVGVFNIDANVAYTGFGGIWQVQSGWTTTTKAEKFNGDGKSVSASAASGVGSEVLAGTWYAALNYSAVLAGRGTNFGVSYGETYNAAAIPMAIASSPINFGLSDSGIKNQLVFSAQRAYFDDNVLFGPEYTYQKMYNGEHMNTLTLDMNVYI